MQGQEAFLAAARVDLVFAFCSGHGICGWEALVHGNTLPLLFLARCLQDVESVLRFTRYRVYFRRSELNGVVAFLQTLGM